MNASARRNEAIFVHESKMV